jgi:hypothetical protein
MFLAHAQIRLDIIFKLKFKFKTWTFGDVTQAIFNKDYTTVAKPTKFPHVTSFA